MQSALLSGLISGVLLVGCLEIEVPKIVGSAVIEPRSGNTTLSGTAYVIDAAGEVSLTIAIKGAPPGKHGLHLHQVGDCSASDASSAGAHWNPEAHTHGKPDQLSHLGDLGNLSIREDGKGEIIISKSAWTVGDGSDHDIMGKAIVFHAAVDDFSEPAGNAGGRIGCGVIKAAAE